MKKSEIGKRWPRWLAKGVAIAAFSVLFAGYSFWSFLIPGQPEWQRTLAEALNVPVALSMFVLPEQLHGIDDYLVPACASKCLGIGFNESYYRNLHLKVAIPIHALWLSAMTLLFGVLGRRIGRKSAVRSNGA